MLNETFPVQRIQLFGIIISILFVAYISRLILKGKLREEYAIVWSLFTLLLLMFSLWRKGIDLLGHFLGVYDPPNLLFACAILIILFYLLHLSKVISKQKEQIKTLSQEIALFKKWTINNKTTTSIQEDENE